MQIELSVLILIILVAIVVPSLITWAIMRNRNLKANQTQGILQEKINLLSSQLTSFESRSDALAKEKLDLEKRLTEGQVRLEASQQKLLEQKQELEQIREKISKEFELISHRLMEKNSETFASLSRKNVDDVINPFKEKLENFSKTVRETYEKGLSERSSLMGAVKELHDMNQRLGTEAENLSKALKGDSKARGNWGEFVLEKVLERSGLRKGEEYTTQESLRDIDQTRYQPDVVIHLPDDKHLIIDSKVSLVAYDAFVSAEDDSERAKQLSLHLQSVRRHIKELGEKGYQVLEDIDAPEFVLMFIPIEASFSLTIQEDRDIFQDAWQKKIVMVSPTTLLATLRTVASIWQHEKQTRNALEIAKEGGALIDKISAIVQDVRRMKSQISTLSNTVDGMITKVEGQGGLVSRARKLQLMGAKSKKELPSNMNESEEEVEE